LFIEGPRFDLALVGDAGVLGLFNGILVRLK